MTNKQEAFCRLLASGMSQADAYRRSYNALNMKPATVRKEAHKLMKNPNVATMVAEINESAREQVVNDRIADRTEVLETLTRMMRGELEADTSRIKATQLLAQAHGLLKDRTEIVVAERPSTEIRAELHKRLSVAVQT